MTRGEAGRPGVLHPRWLAVLNDFGMVVDADAGPVDVDVDLPPARPCPTCRRPTWVGTITCVVDGHADQGRSWSGTWARVTVDGTEALGLHHCPGAAR